MILIQDTPLQEEKTLSLIALIQDGGLGGADHHRFTFLFVDYRYLHLF